MDSKLVKSIDKGIEKLNTEGKNCAQMTLVSVCNTLGTTIEEDNLLAMVSGFGCGIGANNDEGTCGALISGVLALGLYRGHMRWKGIILAEELYKFFQAKYGTVMCGKLCNYGKDNTNCVAYCKVVGRKVAEIITREDTK